MVDCGRQWGKTTMGVDLAAEPALRGYPVGWFNPTYKLLSDAWRELKKVLLPVTARISETEHRLELVTGGVIECWTLEDASAGRGRRYKRVIFDEAAMARNLEEAWEQAVRPTLMVYEGDAWFLSTPKGYNYFHTLFERGLSPEFPDYACWQQPSSTNPYLPPAELAAARLTSSDRVYRQEYEASFVDDATMIFERAWWAGQNRYDPADTGIYHKSIGRWCSWDTAMKDKVTNAYTARVAGELMPNYQLYITNVYRERLTFPALPAVISQDAQQYYHLSPGDKLRGVLIEDKSSGTSALQTLRASAEPWLASMLQGFMPSGDKSQRAEQAAVWCRNGCVVLPNPGPQVPWLMDFENELFTAPQSEFMDQVDAFSQLVLFLENFMAEGWHARGGIAA